MGIDFVRSPQRDEPQQIRVKIVRGFDARRQRSGTKKSPSELGRSASII